MLFLKSHNKKFICRRRLISYTSENILMIHKSKRGNYDITTIRTSSENHLHWKDHFHKNLLFLRNIADFEVDDEIDFCSIGNKTTNIYKQYPVPNGYHIISELGDLLKSGIYDSLLGHDNVEWYLNEVIKLENKMAFYFKNTKKDIFTLEDDEEDFENIFICRFYEKGIVSVKVRDHCLLTSKYQGQAHKTCNINVTQK